MHGLDQHVPVVGRAGPARSAWPAAGPGRTARPARPRRPRRRRPSATRQGSRGRPASTATTSPPAAGRNAAARLGCRSSSFSAARRRRSASSGPVSSRSAAPRTGRRRPIGGVEVEAGLQRGERQHVVGGRARPPSAWVSVDEREVGRGVPARRPRGDLGEQRRSRCPRASRTRSSVEHRARPAEAWRSARRRPATALISRTRGQRHPRVAALADHVPVGEPAEVVEQHLRVRPRGRRGRAR